MCISDGSSDVCSSDVNGDQAIERLGNLLDHPELYEAYPQLKDTEVRVLPESEGFGQYDERRNILHLSMSATDKHSTALHEVQHAIQKIEDMGRGGDPDRSEERRLGKGGVSTGRYRGWPS